MVDKQSIHVLLVEDDEDHAEFIVRTLQRNNVTNVVSRARDGAEALAELEDCMADPARRLPDMVLLDLKLPKLDGHEVLARLKAHNTLRNVPVVVLTTSDTEEDRRRAYAHNVNSYLVKPVNFTRFRRMVEDLEHYWRLWNRTVFDPV